MQLKLQNIPRPTASYMKGIGAELKSELAKKGFPEALFGHAADRYGGQLYVYNRGLQADGVTMNGKSNFFGSALFTGNTVRFWCTNPLESSEASGFDFDKYERSFMFKGMPDRFIRQVTECMAEFSKNKPENAYRIFLHNHLRKTGDDGLSSFEQFLLNLVYHHADLGALTAHNHFFLNEFLNYSKDAKTYGVQLIPGFEATLPLCQYEPWLAGTDLGKTHNPNGPHVLLLSKNPEIMAEFWRANFRDRLYSYAPLASDGVELLKIYDLIDKDYPGSIARLVAHPACDVGLPDVGLFDRAAKGEITIAEMKETVRRSHGIALFNIVVDDEKMDFALHHRQVDECGYFSQEERERRHNNISEAQEYITAVMRKQLGVSVMSPNNISMALGKELSSEFGISAYVDSDAHNFNWLYTRILGVFWRVKDMGVLGKGHNTLWLPSVPEQKPTVEEVVGYMIDKKTIPGATWSAKIFSGMKDGMVQITDARKDISWTQSVFDTTEKIWSYITRQGPELIGNIATASDVSDARNGFDVETVKRGSIPK